MDSRCIAGNWWLPVVSVTYKTNANQLLTRMNYDVNSLVAYRCFCCMLSPKNRKFMIEKFLRGKFCNVRKCHAALSPNYIIHFSPATNHLWRRKKRKPGGMCPRWSECNWWEMFLLWISALRRKRRERKLRLSKHITNQLLWLKINNIQGKILLGSHQYYE